MIIIIRWRGGTLYTKPVSWKIITKKIQKQNKNKSDVRQIRKGDDRLSQMPLPSWSSVLWPRRYRTYTCAVQ